MPVHVSVNISSAYNYVVDIWLGIVWFPMQNYSNLRAKHDSKFLCINCSVLVTESHLSCTPTQHEENIRHKGYIALYVQGK